MNIRKVKIAVLGLICALVASSPASVEASAVGAAKFMGPSIDVNLSVEHLSPTAGIVAKINDSLIKAGNPANVKKSKNEKDLVTSTGADEAFECVQGEGYVTADMLNVRDFPGKSGEIVAKIPFNTKIEYWTTEFENWYAIGDDRYVNAGFVSDEPAKYKTIRATSNTRKSFESHTVLGSNTRQQRLQNMSHTNPEGFKVVNNRFCIAVGSAVGQRVGQYIDVVLANGTVIPCIMGDQKDNRDTDATNQRTKNGCVSEFIVNVKELCRNSKKAANRGDVSFAYGNWESQVVEFRVYDLNILD